MSVQVQVKNEESFIHEVLSNLKVQIKITSNTYDINANDLFSVAARNNTKRSFLFVSKILGKYVPVHPSTSLLIGRLLALKYLEDIYGKRLPGTTKFVNSVKHCLANNQPYDNVHKLLKWPIPEDTLFIGFAETATSLGHSTYSNFNDKCTYIHTTRDKLLGMKSVIEFEEEHSHATSHSVYAVNPHLFNNTHTVVLIDDEITTGNTALNTIKAIQKEYPRHKYTVLTLLDWRAKEDIARYEELANEIGAEIKVVCLLAGEVSVDGSTFLDTKNYTPENEVIRPKIAHVSITDNMQVGVNSISSDGQVIAESYLYHTGRFGISSSDNATIERKAREIGEALRQMVDTDGTTLCLGTGEFLYLPMLISSHMGNNVAFQSTARSPIHLSDKEDYPVVSKYQFNCPYDEGVVQYLYNIDRGQYKSLFLFLERNYQSKAIEPLINALCSLQIPNIHIVTFD